MGARYISRGKLLSWQSQDQCVLFVKDGDGVALQIMASFAFEVNFELVHLEDNAPFHWIPFTYRYPPRRGSFLDTPQGRPHSAPTLERLVSTTTGGPSASVAPPASRA